MNNVFSTFSQTFLAGWILDFKHSLYDFNSCSLLNVKCIPVKHIIGFYVLIFVLKLIL